MYICMYVYKKAIWGTFLTRPGQNLLHQNTSAVRSTEHEDLSKSFGQFFYLSKSKSGVEKCYKVKVKSNGL